MTTGKVTTDHDTIQHWIEQRGGKPARVKSTSDPSGGGVLRVDFPDRHGDDRLETISWDRFFATFDERELAFLYQDETADGHESRFSKFVERGDAHSSPSHDASPRHESSAQAAKAHRGGHAPDHKKQGRPHAKG